MQLPTSTQPYHFSRAAVELALTELGIDCRFGPKEAVVQCVFANEEGKHLYINLLEKPGVAHCFRCGARCNLEAFVKAYTGWSFIQVAIFLKKCRDAVSSETYEPQVRFKPKQVGPDDERLAPYWFRHQYALDRGIMEETLKRFCVGYDKEANAITFPWFERSGKLIAIKRRNVLDKFYTAEQDIDLSTAMFGINLARQNANLWITEGEFDCMFLDQCFRLGHMDNHHALALGGTMLRKSLIFEMCYLQPDSIVLLLDNDTAGRDAQEIIRRQLLPYAPVNQVEYPEGIKDPNELLFEQVVHLVRSLPPKKEYQHG
jgi:DNA primase